MSLNQRPLYNMSTFDIQLYLDTMLKDKRKHIQIIGLFAKAKAYSFENKEQVQWLIRRNSRTAKRLECFTLEKISNTLNYLIEHADFKITLETIEKYILETPEELKGEEPIIILKSGEKIYDTKRIIQLEHERKIYYTGTKWQER